MAVKELGPGEVHSFAATPLRAVVAGPGAQHVTLRIMDEEADYEENPIRLSPLEVILTPQARAIRLDVVPADGGTFAPGTFIGVSLRTEGASAGAEQILVAQVDVGALASYTVARLEFSPGQARCVAGHAPRFSPASAPAGQPPPNDSRAIETRPWMAPGRYAIRTAAQRKTLTAAPNEWTLIVDASASMTHIVRSGSLTPLVNLVAGMMVEWTGTPLTSLIACGASGPFEVADAGGDPGAAVTGAYENLVPGSSFTLTAALAMSQRRTGPSGAVVVVTDGVPGDIDRILDGSRHADSPTIFVVTMGESVLNVPLQPPPAWWREELAPLTQLHDYPNVFAVALRLDEEELPRIDEIEAAELADLLTTSLGGNAR